jgi:TolA-binding protein
MPSLHAQLAPEPEVRRALPVTLTSPPQIPAIPVMKALPAFTPALQTENLPKQLSSPSPGRVTNPVNEPQSIRIAPTATRNPEELATAQLSLADNLFDRKQSESAVPEYEKFLIMASKNSPGKDRALYRLGESQRLMGSKTAAEATFRKLVESVPPGEFTASAAYRLAEILEDRGDAPAAADNFALAARGAVDPSIRNTALYREALVREKIDQPEQAAQARALLTAIADGNSAGSFKMQALMHLAARDATLGKREQALEWYQRILSTPPPQTTPEALSEVALKAAILESELGKTEEASKLFEKVATSKDSGKWGNIAALGALRLAAQAGNDQAVLALSGRALSGDPDEKPEILLLRANALRKLGKNTQALAEYDAILKEFPGSKAASLAPFQRLLSLYALRNPQLFTEIDGYLLTASDPGDRARAQLLKAEETLRNGKYTEAAAMYHGIQTDALPPGSGPDILYKETWALIQADNKAPAAEALDRFLAAYPDDNRVPTALAQRGQLRQQQKDFAGALADFNRLQQQYPKAPERELALQQKSLILGQQQENEAMSETFSLLLSEYPKSKAVAQAHYWIGWAALEKKDYPKAVSELSQAREADPKQFGERSGLRILLAEYYQNHVAKAAREAAALKASPIPPEVGEWLGMKCMESGDNAKAERFLSPLVRKGLPGASDPQIQSSLASALIAQGKFREAQVPASACLKLSHDPASRARALLVAAAIQNSMKKCQEASSMTDEAMLLQPEGSINAEARILSGDILTARLDYAAAAKAYMTAAVLYDDPEITPKALAKAANAYQKAGNQTEAAKTADELRKRFPNAPVRIIKSP